MCTVAVVLAVLCGRDGALRAAGVEAALGGLLGLPLQWHCVVMFFLSL